MNERFVVTHPVHTNAFLDSYDYNFPFEKANITFKCKKPNPTERIG